MVSSQLVTVYGRSVELPAIESLSLPDAQDPQPSVSLRMGEKDGEGARHVSGMRMWFDENCVTVYVPLEYGPLATEHLLLDHAVPIALAVRGDTVIHGAGFARNGHGALLLGKSGRGKSTTSQYLSNNGWRLLSDDAVRVECTDDGLVMWPSYGGVRLHESAFEVLGAGLPEGSFVAEYGTKRRFEMGSNFSLEPARVSAAFVLGEASPDVQCRPIGPAKLLGVLGASSFNVPGEKEDVPKRLQELTPVAERLTGYELSFERQPDILARLNTVITETLIDDGVE